MDALAERLGVTERHVRRLVAERRIPFVKVGRFVRFDPTDVAAWLDSCRFTPRSPSHPLGTLLDEEPVRPARGARSGSQRPGAA
ncbi:MAG: helix-turn-helix domain-containing protein [Acidimicrobiia bacterium]